MAIHDLICTWCDRPFQAARRDALTCSKPCRQARHRAGFVAQDLQRDGPPRHLAYADPPYPGSARHYRDQPDWNGEIDLSELLLHLRTYDAWALSTSARALPRVLSLCTGAALQVRVAAWIRAPRPHATARILSAWEPLIYRADHEAIATRQTPAVLDVLTGPTPRRRSTLPHAIIGMKPPAFAIWMFKLLGGSRGDTFDDLFPGSGIITNAWLHYTGQRPVNHKQPRARDDNTGCRDDTSPPAPGENDRT